MKNNLRTLLAILSIFCFNHSVSSQDNSPTTYTISGYIEDAATGEKLIGANLYEPILQKGATSNTYGFYSLTLPADSVLIRVSYTGYEPRFLRFLLNEDKQFNVQLGEGALLKEIVVTDKRYKKVENQSQMSVVEVPIEQIKKIPSLLGETDVLKALQLLPGVQSGNEGSNGVFVRGGSPDQNLILLDGVPVYNVSHLFGFFSVFNADAIKDVKLIKGGFPARYGGRLSSVIDINMKEGNQNDFQVEGAVGIISSKLTVEGPIKKEKSSFIVSGRRTYIDLIARPLIKQQTDGEAVPGYYFYDLNAKFNYKFSEKDRLYLSAYTGEDKFSIKINDEYQGGSTTSSNSLDWGNITSALRWNHLFNNKLFSNTTLTYSRYELDIGIGVEDRDGTDVTEFNAKYFSGITDFAAKVDFDWVPNPSHYIRFGANAIAHTFKPGALQFNSKFNNISLDTLLGNQNTDAGEYAVYVENDWEITNRLKANIGLHGSGFAVDKKFYASIQPRISARYLFQNNFSAKASFATMQQYINLLSAEGIGLPTDLWVPSTGRVKPQSSYQVAAGVAKSLDNGMEFTLEGYYKSMNNLVSYKEGADFISLEDNWQDKVEQGTGESYGVEMLVQKKTGKTTGWLGYTLAWSNRSFENINAGKPYSFKYDRRHDISVVVSHELSKKISLNGVWVYGTGNAVTVPVIEYRALLLNNWADLFDSPGFIPYTNVGKPNDKNSFRMAPYHRLDLSIEFSKKKPKYERKWVIGAYNAYNRKNPFFLTEGADAQGNDVLQQVSLFPIIPSVSFQFKFK